MESFEYSIKYSLESVINEEAPERYINKYDAEIFVKKLSGENLKVGRLLFDIILVNQAMEHDYYLYDIFDSFEETMLFAEEFIDFDTSDFKQNILDEADDDIFLENICLITELKLLPGFRGKNNGSKIIKDLYNRFSEGVGLFVIKSVPFQSTMVTKMKSGHYDDDAFSKAMKYEDLEFDEEIAQYKLNAFFQKLGFRYLSNDYFYLNTKFIQDKINSIEW